MDYGFDLYGFFMDFKFIMDYGMDMDLVLNPSGPTANVISTNKVTNVRESVMLLRRCDACSLFTRLGYNGSSL